MSVRFRPRYLPSARFAAVLAYEIPLEDSTRDFLNEQAQPIPAGGPVVSSTLVLDQDRTLEELDVSVEISHGEPAFLIVELRSPLGTKVRLHDRSPGTPGGLAVRYDLERRPDGPGSMADFVGQSTLGEWTLTVQDMSVASPGGTLVSWTLHATVDGAFDCDTRVCGEPRPTEAPFLLLSKTVDGPEIDLVLDWSAVTTAGYHVLQSIAPAFDGDVDLIGRTTSRTTWTIEDGVNGTPDLTFFQVRGVNTCHQEGP
jgi:subtilisin-like proprotein convertase family protein